ncbi:hypothetical protein BS50DRAFT_517405 [Corynespora cassiicola Philippines]|uniref:Rhodopsin domain-containing protein n=1 Tax=Corynespora cassiicola Philippines TaxID=1448308 RepID=A0A2T2NZB7_CORCC|nr:hypothetical protein BS50DRAFT_517405 [Corynespora cassiicola Philippines]
MDEPLSPTGAGSHRFAPITAYNRAGLLWIALILCLIYSFLVLIVRLHIKWKLYGLDDATAALATFLQFFEVICLFLGLQQGLGRSDPPLNDDQTQFVGKTTFASHLFFISSLAAAKASVALLMLRLFTRDIEVTRKSWVLCHITVAFTIAWGFGSIVALSVSCIPSSLISDDASRLCSSQLLRWRIIAFTDIFIEIMLISLPVIFIWRIQMKRYIKLQVVVAFGFRLPVIAFAVAHLHNVATYLKGGSKSKGMIAVLVYQQFELFWALMSATIPTLKTFMRSFNSGFGMEIDLDGYGYGTSGNETYQMNSLRSKQASGNSTNTDTLVLPGRIRDRGQDIQSASYAEEIEPAKPGHDVQEQKCNSFHSQGSQELIIKRAL